MYVLMLEVLLLAAYWHERIVFTRAPLQGN